MNLYRDHSSYPLPNAQYNLQGRNHYVDSSILRYFHSRVLSARHFADGLLFAIVESCAGDHENRTRIFRPVVFDVFGEVVHRTPTESGHKSRDKATVERDAFIKGFDVVAHTLQAIKTQRARALADFDRLAVTVAGMRKES